MCSDGETRAISEHVTIMDSHTNDGPIHETLDITVSSSIIVMCVLVLGLLSIGVWACCLFSTQWNSITQSGSI